MDDDQQFCLRWNNHQSTLISVFDTLLENGTLVDCTLAAEGKFLKAHKVVLSACSPYFATLLSQQYDKHPIFILKDVKFQELRAMMDYMYRGEVNISQDQLAALLKAAESLQIKGLSDSRGGGNNSTNMPSQAHLKGDGKSSHVPAPKASGLTIENKRPLRTDFDADVTGSREGSVSPSTRKRKKVNQRRKSLAESNSLLDNHDQHSNSSSHSNNQQQQQQQLSNTSATSAPSNNLSVTNKKTEHDSNQQDHQDNGDDEAVHITKRSKNTDADNKDSELMIEPKNEYDEDDDDEDGNVEDLTMDDEMLDDLDQAGPSHGGEGSSQGYHWQMDGRSQESQEAAGQHRDAQAEDLSITKIAGLTWEQWNERLTAMPLVTTLREGAHPLVFPRDLCVSTMETKFRPEERSPNGSTSSASGNQNSSSGNGAGMANNDGFTCPDCGRMYKLKSSLRNHQKWECGKEPQFQCPYCVYRAKQKMHIGRHMERMHKEKFFKVESDGKIIALEEALNHIVQTTGCGDFNATM